MLLPTGNEFHRFLVNGINASLYQLLNFVVSATVSIKKEEELKVLRKQESRGKKWKRFKKWKRKKRK